MSKGARPSCGSGRREAAWNGAPAQILVIVAITQVETLWAEVGKGSS